MRRISIAIGAGLVALMLASCGTTEPGATLPAPEVTGLSIADSGVTLVISWSPVDGAKGYKIMCDGQEIADLVDTATSYAINGNDHVCRSIKLAAHDGKGNMGDAYTKDLMEERDVTVYSTDDTVATNPSWVKIDFTNFTVNAVTQDNVVAEDNIGYFVYYYDSNLGTRIFKDAKETSVGQVSEEIAFTNHTDATLAPSTGYSLISETVDEGDRFIFWSDDVNSGTYGDFDEEDNFGVIKVNAVNGTEADLTIYIQTVGGLRWVKE